MKLGEAETSGITAGDDLDTSNLDLRWRLETGGKILEWHQPISNNEWNRDEAHSINLPIIEVPCLGCW